MEFLFGALQLKPNYVKYKFDLITLCAPSLGAKGLLTSLIYIKKLELLKLHDLYKLEIAKIMHKLFNNKLPPILKSRFVKTDMIHAHETRSVKQSNYFLKSVCQNSIAFCGAKMWNEIDNDLKHSSL